MTSLTWFQTIHCTHDGPHCFCENCESLQIASNIDEVRPYSIRAILDIEVVVLIVNCINHVTY